MRRRGGKALVFENVDHAWRDWPRARPADSRETPLKVYVDIGGLTRHADVQRLRAGGMPFATPCMLLVSRLSESHAVLFDRPTQAGGVPVCPHVQEASRGGSSLQSLDPQGRMRIFPFG